jgi:hypothetical protein
MAFFPPRVKAFAEPPAKPQKEERGPHQPKPKPLCKAIPKSSKDFHSSLSSPFLAAWETQARGRSFDVAHFLHSFFSRPKGNVSSEKSCR